MVYCSLNLLKVWSKDLCCFTNLSFRDKYRNRGKCLETAITSILTSFIIVVWGTEKSSARLKYKMQQEKWKGIKSKARK